MHVGILSADPAVPKVAVDEHVKAPIIVVSCSVSGPWALGNSRKYFLASSKVNEALRSLNT